MPYRPCRTREASFLEDLVFLNFIIAVQLVEIKMFLSLFRAKPVIRSAGFIFRTINMVDLSRIRIGKINRDLNISDVLTSSEIWTWSRIIPSCAWMHSHSTLYVMFDNYITFYCIVLYLHELSSNKIIALYTVMLNCFNNSSWFHYSGLLW